MRSKGRGSVTYHGVVGVVCSAPAIVRRVAWFAVLHGSEFCLNMACASRTRS